MFSLQHSMAERQRERRIEHRIQEISNPSHVIMGKKIKTIFDAIALKDMLASSMITEQHYFMRHAREKHLRCQRKCCVEYNASPLCCIHI